MAGGAAKAKETKPRELEKAIRVDDAKSTIYLSNPTRLDAHFQGPDAIAGALHSGHSKPLSIAVDDFDGGRSDRSRDWLRYAEWRPYRHLPGQSGCLRATEPAVV